MSKEHVLSSKEIDKLRLALEGLPPEAVNITLYFSETGIGTYFALKYNTVVEVNLTDYDNW